MTAVPAQTASPAPRSRFSALRRTIVAVIIATFSIAAVGGIAALLGAELGDTALRVLGTTAVVGAFSVAVLCCAALLGRAQHGVGIVGVVVSVIGAALSVWMIWFPGPQWDVLGKLTGTAITLTAALALASLLLLLADRRRAAVRTGLVVTLALFVVVAAMIVYLIWASDTVDDQIFPRVLGVAAILAALGAVVVPVLSLLLPDAHTGLSRASIARIEDEARRRGVDADDLVATLLPPHPLEDR